MELYSLAGKVRLFIIAVLVLAAILSFLVVHQYESDFRQHHQGLAEHSVQSVNKELARLLGEMKRDTSFFALHNQQLLWQMSLYPEDESKYSQISNLLGEFLPDYYAFTLTDSEGKPFYSDFRETINEQYDDNIKQLASESPGGHDGTIMVHPSPGEHHFDIIVPWHYQGSERGVFFISFRLDVLSRLLKLGQAHQHSLLLMHQENPDLIEVTADGGRDVLQTYRTDRLSVSELARILYSQKLEDTQWTLVDLHDENLLSDDRLRLFRPLIVAWVVILILSALSWLSIRDYERRRHSAVQNLKKSHDLLDEEITDKIGKLKTTKRQLQEETSRRSEAESMQYMLNTAVEQSSESIVITNKWGIFKYVNLAFERMSGYSAAEVIGKSTRLVKSGTMEQSFYEELWNTISEKQQPFSGIFHNRRKDGELIYVDQTIAPLLDTSGDIEYFIATGRDITEDRNTKRKLKYVVNHDLLTGIHNIDYIENHINTIIFKDRTGKSTFALIQINLDQFHKIVAELGRQAGDQILIALAKQLDLVCGEHDILARISGDEFLFYIEQGMNQDEFAPQIERIFETIRKPILLLDDELTVTASLGIALYPQDGNTTGQLFKSTLVALKRAKESGGDRYEFYQQGMTELASAQIKLERQLTEAINNKELTFSYQPKVNIQNGELLGFEALARWQNARTGEQIPPDVFISILENNGLIYSLFMHSIVEACGLIRDVLLPANSNLKIAVNLSVKQIANTNLFINIRDHLENFQVPASALEFEITESMFIESVQLATALLEDISSLGCPLSMDDFGTGYSTMQYLKLLPIDTIKIDKSFIIDIHTSEGDRIFTETMINMSHTLGKQILAEGVENREQLELLQQMGCDAIQGFLVSEPIEADELKGWIQSYDPKVFSAG